MGNGYNYCLPAMGNHRTLLLQLNDRSSTVLQNPPISDIYVTLQCIYKKKKDGGCITKVQYHFHCFVPVIPHSCFGLKKETTCWKVIAIALAKALMYHLYKRLV